MLYIDTCVYIHIYRFIIELVLLPFRKYSGIWASYLFIYFYLDQKLKFWIV